MGHQNIASISSRFATPFKQILGPIVNPPVKKVAHLWLKF